MDALDYKPLVDGIRKFGMEYSYLELARRSGISGPAINRIANQVTRRPDIDTWHKLHLAAPQYIPLPSINLAQASYHPPQPEPLVAGIAQRLLNPVQGALAYWVGGRAQYQQLRQRLRQLVGCEEAEHLALVEELVENFVAIASPDSLDQARALLAELAGYESQERMIAHYSAIMAWPELDPLGELRRLLSQMLEQLQARWLSDEERGLVIGPIWEQVRHNQEYAQYLEHSERARAQQRHCQLVRDVTRKPLLSPRELHIVEQVRLLDEPGLLAVEAVLHALTRPARP